MHVEEHFHEFTRRDWQVRREGTVRFAVVGLGGFSRQRALPAIRESTFCEATVLVSGSPDTAELAATEFGADHVIDYESFVDGAGAEAYDAVYVATPPAFHREYVEAAAGLGKHVLCEKPLATNAGEARAIIDACEDAGVTLMTAYRLQTEPAVRRSREVIADGCIGEPVRAYGGFSTKLLEHVGPDTWRLDPGLAGGGALIDIGVYPLNTLRFLLDRDPIATWGTTSSTHDAFDAVEENVAFTLRFPDGVTASCTASFNAHPASQLQVLGTEGQLRITAPFGGEVPQHILVECGDVSTEYTGPPVDEVVEEFDYFAHCVLEGASPEPDGRDGVTDLAVVEATYEAAETGCLVRTDDGVS